MTRYPPGWTPDRYPVGLAEWVFRWRSRWLWARYETRREQRGWWRASVR